MPTQVSVSSLSGGRGLRIEGELDASNVVEVAGLLEEEVRGEGDVTLDLTELRFIDSAGVHAVISSAKSLEGKGTMRILCPPGPVRKVLDLVGIQETLAQVEMDPAGS